MSACESVVLIDDDDGEEPFTMRCELLAGHYGLHETHRTDRDPPLRITWFGSYPAP